DYEQAVVELLRRKVVDGIRLRRSIEGMQTGMTARHQQPFAAGTAECESLQLWRVGDGHLRQDYGERDGLFRRLRQLLRGGDDHEEQHQQSSHDRLLTSSARAATSGLSAAAMTRDRASPA